jgi:hypothetical protein
MKKFSLVAILLLNNFAFAQVELKGVMGIYFFSAPSMQDYINQNFAPSNDQLSSFVSSVMFAGEGGYFISPNFITTVELAYQLYSYTTGSTGGLYDLTYTNVMPTLLGYYVVSGKGYNFKFGGGVGVRFSGVDESLPATGVKTSYSSVGYGIIGRIEGNSLLGGGVYANIGADIRYDANGEPENNGTPLYNNIRNENVNFNAFSVGVRLGITYIIGGGN